MTNDSYIEKILKIHAEEVNILAMRNNMLEKALDKACELLEDGYGYEYPHEMYNEPFIDYMKVEEWKEWLLKNG